jgi:ATP adenylyltransferase
LPNGCCGPGNLNRSERFVDRLYTPWRYAYVTGRERREGCVFCEVLASKDDVGNSVLYRARHWLVMLNRFPYNNGHLLLVLGRHKPRMSDCTADELQEMGVLLAAMERSLCEALRPQGFNGGYNAGSSAGAGIPEHLHLHLLPRWAGDTNFITTVGRTRVMPQTLEEVRELLSPVLARILAPNR